MSDSCGGEFSEIYDVDDSANYSCQNGGIDYYGILELPRDCNELDVQKAYKKLAQRFIPSRRKHDKEQAAVIFALVAEAYEVLSNSRNRAVYDQYGEEGLKKGVPGPDDYIQPFFYHGDPMKTYRDFFASISPYANLLDALENPLPFYDSPEGRGVKVKNEPVVHQLPLTLSEIFFGGLKKMKIQRLEPQGIDGATTDLKSKILSFPIRPGMPTGTKIVFAEQGDQGPTKIPADIIFVTEDRPHDVFERDGANLYMTKNIFLSEALTGFVVTVNTIDDRMLRVPITSVVSPDYVKTVPTEGLPFYENPDSKGDLFIVFDIEFPIYMPLSSKSYVRKIFKNTRKERGSIEDLNRYILENKIRKNIDEDIPIRRSKTVVNDKIKNTCP